MTLLEAWARDGMIDKQIAKKMGISVSTLNEWKKKYPIISESLKRGKEIVDITVENALLKRALGYEYEEVTTEIRKIPYTARDGTEKEREEKHVKKTTRIVLPDTTAQIFWLKNRRPDIWRDKHEVVDTTATDKLDEYLEAVNESVMER